MHRVPLGFAVFLLIILIFLAIGGDTKNYKIDQGAIWTVIVINSLFIIVPLYRASVRKRESIEAIQNVKKDYVVENIQKQKSLNYSFNKVTNIIQNNPNDEQINFAINTLKNNARQGHLPSLTLLEEFNVLVEKYDSKINCVYCGKNIDFETENSVCSECEHLLA